MTERIPGAPRRPTKTGKSKKPKKGKGRGRSLVTVAMDPTAGRTLVGGQTGIGSFASLELTRPADVAAYAAKDAVSDSTTAPTVLTFPAMATFKGGMGRINKVRMLTDQKTFVARLRLHLFSVAPTAVNDNAPFTLLYANAPNYVGWVDLPAATTEDPTGSTAAVALATVGTAGASLPLTYSCAAGDTALYGMLETLDAFTPNSGQKFYVRMDGDVY